MTTGGVPSTQQRTPRAARSRRPATALLALLLGAPVGAAGAQGASGRTLPVPVAQMARPRGEPAGRDGEAVDSAGGAPSREEEGVAVVAHGSPRTFQIVTVPVPNAFGRDLPVAFEVLATGSATLLGARQGVLAPPEGAEARSLSLTVGVPARALAGRQRVAQVHFAASGQQDVVTPVDLDVAPVRRVDVLVTPPLVAARAGQDVPVRYRLTNLGNAVDSVHVHVESIDPSPVAPVDGALVVLPVNAARDLTVHVPLPRSTPASVIAVELRVVGADGEERATAQASLEVVTAARGPGGTTPALTTSLAAPLGMRGGAPALALALQGPVANDVRVEGRWTRLGTSDPMAVTALTRLGYYDVPASLALASSHWRAAGGAAGAKLTDLTGGAAWGVGATATVDTADWRGALVVARPGLARNDGTHGVLAGATASHRIGARWVTASLAHLVEEQQIFERKLDALSLGAILPVAYDATVDAELAAREWAGGTGLGARVDVDRRTAHDNATLRLLHAAGGSAAFAPARDELSASGARVVNARWILAGSGWWNGDAGVIDRGMHSDGFTLQPQLLLSDRTSVSLRLRSSAFAMSGAVTSIATAERDLGAVVSTRRNTLYASGTLAIGTRSRDSRSALTTASFGEHVTRSTTEGTAGWTSAFGTLEADFMVERNVAGIGITPDRSQVGIRADRVVVNPNWTGIYLGGSVRRTGFLGERQQATLGNLALTADLRWSLRATLGVQHNSFFAPGAGRWTTVLGLERTIGLPRPQRRRSGHVFEDLNGNGLRDEGEPGFAGAVVRSGAATVATGDDGRFRLPLDARPVVDSRSLPVGWLPGPTPAKGSEGAAQWSDLAVVPTSVVEIELVRAANTDGRLPRGDLAAADVMARDAAGRLWMARVTPAGVAVFDALPPGEYRVELDLARLKEPLTTREALPTFSVQAAPSRRRFTVSVMPRPLKMWRPSTAGDATGAAAGGRP